MYRSHQWAQMVLLREKVTSGELSADEYKAIIGWRAPDELPLPTPKLPMGGGTWLHNTRTVINAADSSNDHIKAADKLEFIVRSKSLTVPAHRSVTHDHIQPFRRRAFAGFKFLAKGDSFAPSRPSTQRLPTQAPGKFDFLTGDLCELCARYSHSFRLPL
jgi:hypothetical protein